MSSYWQKRQFNQQKILLDKTIEETDFHLATIYKSSMREVEKDMKSLYLDLQNQSANGEVKINDLYRYNRYWQLRSDLNRKLVSLGEKEVKLLDKQLVGQYMAVQKYFNENPKFMAKTVRGIAKEVSTIPVDLTSPLVSENALSVVNSIWCADGKYWSDRVWQHKEELQAAVEQGLIDTITRGVGPDELTKTLMKEFNKEFHTAQTLVRTELAHVYNQAAAERYAAAGCEYYEVLSAQSDDECFDMNGMEVSFKEMVEGENAPPFH